MKELEHQRIFSVAVQWTVRMEIVSLAVMLLMMPVDSGVSLVSSLFWMFFVALKNTLLKRWSFFGWHQDKHYRYSRNYCFMIPMMCYWFIYLLSMLWTENKPAGWGEIAQLSCFLFMPLTCACTDFRHISGKTIRKLLWLFVLILSVLFLVLLSREIIRACRSAEHSFLWFMMNEDFYYIHHSYMALYILVGLAFLYSEMVRKEKIGVWRLVMMAGCACCLILFLLCINSRAGLLCLILLLMCSWVHLCFVRKKYRMAMVSLIVMIVAMVAVHSALPKYFHRLSVTVESVSKGDKSDARFLIMRNAWTVIQDNMVMGVGAGDRMDELRPFYVTGENLDETTYNPHNQYLDTWMATGIMGLLSLLAMISLPFVLAWRKRQVFPFMAMLVLSVSFLFESMLERQMGIVFVGVIYVFFVLFFDTESIDNKNIIVSENEKENIVVSGAHERYGHGEKICSRGL